MPSIDNKNDLVPKTALLMVAVSLNVLELFFPRIPLLPWIKPGFANCVTIIWICRFGMRDALLFSLLRVWLSGFYTGFSFVTLVLALSGGIFSVLAMGTLWKMFSERKWIGAIALGCVGAVAHNTGQLTAAWLTIAHNVMIWYQTPIMLIASCVSGTITGLMATGLIRIVDAQSTTGSSFATPELPSRPPAHLIMAGIMLLIGSALLSSIMSIPLLAGIAIIVITCLLIHERSVLILVQPFKRFWLLFLIIALFHLCFSYGTRFEGIPLVTHEGLHEAIRQVLMLYIWLSLTVFFKRIAFYDTMFWMLEKFFGRYRDTLIAGIITLERFGVAFNAAQEEARKTGKQFFTNPVQGLRSATIRIYRRCEDIAHK